MSLKKLISNLDMNPTAPTQQSDQTILEQLETGLINPKTYEMVESVMNDDKLINQSVNQLIDKPINQLANESINELVSQPINQSIDKLINQSTNELTNQSVNQLIDKPAKKLTGAKVSVALITAMDEMVFFEKRKGNIITKEDIFENAFRDYLTKSGYLKE
jgi:uncharacterized membrane-anchored protein YjiN (DUF445 family)